MSIANPKKTHLRKTAGIVAMAGFMFLSLSFDTAYSLTSTRIKDLLDHPRDYEGKDIVVDGTVTNAVSLVVIKYYEIQDSTGSIRVVTEKLLPTRGEKLKVSGRMTVIEIGTERWVIIRESSDAPAQVVDRPIPERNADQGDRPTY